MGLATFLSLLFFFFSVKDAAAGFVGQFSLSAGEEYNDNLFFSDRKTHDFVSSISPRLNLFYFPPPETRPTFTLNFTSPFQIFQRHSERNNFGENLSLASAYTYYHSPRLTFHISDSLRRLGQSRTTGLGTDSIGGAPSLPTAPPASGGTQAPFLSERVVGLVSRGAALTNNLSIQGRFLFAPQLTLSGGYALGSESFLDQGGSDLTQSVSLRTIYNWGERHNLHAAYSSNIINSSSRNGSSNVVHNVDVGDDYLNRIDIAPTLTLSVSTGISVNTGNSGPRIANRTNLILLKNWEVASLSAGVRRGLTSSFGVSGLSLTTSFFGGLNIRLTESLTGNVRVDLSLFNTNNIDFQTFQTDVGLQYWFSRWLSLNARYSHRFSDGANGTGARINGNSVSLSFSALFDVWPNVGPSRALTSASGFQAMGLQPLTP